MKWYGTLLILVLILCCCNISLAVKIQWLGQSCFLITAQDGTKLITDPYEPGGFEGKLTYGPITTKADIVTVSHEHADHNYVKGVPGTPEVFKTVGIFTTHNMTIHGVVSYHDKEQGANRGSNTIYCFTIDGVRICHLGDLGHLLNPSQIKQIKQTGEVDVLMIPVGGVYTIDAADATRVVDQLKPKIVIPMHYKTDKVKLGLKPVDEYIGDKKNVIKRNSSTMEVTNKSLSPGIQIDVLTPSL